MIKVLAPENNKIQGKVEIPSSKSISNRALVIQALCSEKIYLENISISDDTQILQNALTNVANRNTIHKPKTIDVGLAGTSFRFLTAFLSLQKGEYILTGDKRIKERPIKQLVDALILLGAKIDYIEKIGFAPLKIKGKKLIGKTIKIDANISSQFITALMLIAPRIKNGITIILEGEISSKPYITMTEKLMNYFSVETKFKGNIIKIEEQNYKQNTLKIEADWSSSSYFYEAVALADYGELTLTNYYKNSIQGDSSIYKIFKNFGVKTKFENDNIILSKVDFDKKPFVYNFINEPDLVQAVLCTCLALNIEAKVTGIESLKIKETNRIEALNSEFNKLNWEFVEIENGKYSLQKLSKPFVKDTLVFETYKDHRMAMCLAPIVLKYKKVNILDYKVVSKSNPIFWELLQQIGFKLLKK